MRTKYKFSTREETIQSIKLECIRQGLMLNTQIAYILATVEWETARTYRPVREAYWRSERWRSRHLKYYPYYGRGFVQLTWKRNYMKYSKLTGLNLIKNPDIALDPNVALYILVDGFRRGAFTGRNIKRYINRNKTDFKNARRCINAMDKSMQIATIANRILKTI